MPGTHTSESLGLNKVYDDFFIFGCKKPKLSDFSQENELEISTLFSLYSPNDAETVSTVNQISKFVLPFSKKFRVVKVKNNYSKLQESIFQSKSIADFSFFSLNNNTTSAPKLTRQQEDAIKFNPQFEILKKTNPNKFSYYYCLRIEDFFIKEPQTGGVKTDLIELYFYPRAFIIKTLYPFSKLFHDFLTVSIDLLKQKRLASFQPLKKLNKVSVESLLAIDGQAVLNSEIEFFVGCLQSMDDMRITNNFGQDFQFKIQNKVPLEYTLPSIENSFYTECEIGFNAVFNYFTFEDFLFVLFSIFNEKSLVFVSENLFLISACISTFLALIRPLKWPFPIIYSLPEDCLLMLGSPIPVIVGLNLPSFHVVNDILPEFQSVSENNNSNNVYVFLDNGLFYYDFENHDNIILPQFNDFIDRFQKCYQKSFNPRTSNWFRVRKNPKGKSTINVLKSLNSPKMKESILKLGTVLIDRHPPKITLERISEYLVGKKMEDYSVFYLFNQFLNGFLLSKLTKENQTSSKKGFSAKDGDIGVFGLVTPGDAEFLEKFVRTQAFIYYVENELCNFHYGENK